MCVCVFFYVLLQFKKQMLNWISQKAETPEDSNSWFSSKIDTFFCNTTNE